MVFRSARAEPVEAEQVVDSKAGKAVLVVERQLAEGAADRDIAWPEGTAGKAGQNFEFVALVLGLEPGALRE